MKVMLGTDTYAPDINGAARFTERLALGLAERGHEVHVVCPSEDSTSHAASSGPLSVHGIRSHRYPLHASLRICFPWQVFPETKRLVREVAPDVVHLQSHWVIGRGLARAADHQGVGLVATNHMMPENLVGYVPFPDPVLRAMVRWTWHDLGEVFGRAGVVTAPTPRAVSLLAKHTDFVDPLAISCGIDAERYAAASAAATPGSVPTVLFVGRLDQEKRVEELLQACAGLPDDLPVRVEIIGDGDRRLVLVNLAARLGLARKVAFRGQVSEEDLLKAYGRADVFCMPGIAELQSLVTLEAMSAGKPIIAANAMALPHLVHSGQNGWLYEPGDIGELTFRLATLLGDEGLRRKMGAVSRRLVAKHDIGATVDRFEQLYRQVRIARPTSIGRAA